MSRNIRKIALLFSLCFLFLQGCVNRAPIAQEEWQQMVKAQHMENDDPFFSYTQRVIPGKSVREVIEASQELFTLMDGKDMKMEVGEASVSAMRDWYVWALMVAMNGWDYWNVSASPSTNNSADTLVTITQASESMGQLGGVSTGNVTIGTGAFSTNAKVYTDEACYRLFWQRLDYLLGLSDVWINCKQARQWAADNGYSGKLGAMCEFTSDNAPSSEAR